MFLNKQSKTERYLTVGYDPQKDDKNTPKICISGDWLKEAGFAAGAKVRVKVNNGCLVLIAEDELITQQRAVLAEIKRTEQRINDLTTGFVVNSRGE